MRDDHVAVLLEDIQSTVQKLADGVAALQEDNIKINAHLETIEEYTAEIPVIKAALIDNSDRIENHERRITKLETAA